MGWGYIEMTRATKPKARERVRDAERTRELILDAAERLFAEKGYEESSLADVGSAAGVSRATPGYFFGSKAELHRAVIERCFADPSVRTVLVDPLDCNIRAHRFYERLGFEYVVRRRFGEDSCFVYRLARPAHA